jgi:hypothetical protein
MTVMRGHDRPDVPKRIRGDPLERVVTPGHQLDTFGNGAVRADGNRRFFALERDDRWLAVRPKANRHMRILIGGAQRIEDVSGRGPE